MLWSSVYICVLLVSVYVMLNTLGCGLVCMYSLVICIHAVEQCIYICVLLVSVYVMVNTRGCGLVCMYSLVICIHAVEQSLPGTLLGGGGVCSG